MNKKFLVAYFIFSSMFMSQVHAAIVRATENPIFVTPGQSFTFTLEGAGFTTPADGGGINFSWDDSVLSYIGINIFTTPWDTSFVEDSAAKSGTSNQVDFVLFGTTGPAQGPDFNIAEITFDFIGQPGSASDIVFADAFGGWSTTGALPINNVSYETVRVNSVPLPSSVIFMLTGVLSFVRFAIPKKSI